MTRRDAIAEMLRKGIHPSAAVEVAERILALPEMQAEMEASYQAGYQSGVEAQYGLERAANPAREAVIEAARAWAKPLPFGLGDAVLDLEAAVAALDALEQQ